MAVILLMLASSDDIDFKLAITTPTLGEWGQFTDAYGDSPSEDLDDEFDRIGDCNDSAMWEGEEIKYVVSLGQVRTESRH